MAARKNNEEARKNVGIHAVIFSESDLYIRLLHFVRGRVKKYGILWG